MFAQHSVTIPHPAVEVSALFASPKREWIVSLDADGDQLLARVGVKVGRIPVFKQVRLRVGRVPSVLPADRVMLPVGWESVGGPPIFPRMEGTLHVQPEGELSTRLTLNASYDPPFGKLGELIDRALLHRLAQATMEDFVNRLAANLEASWPL